MQWVASTLHTTSEHGVSSITTADGAHLSCQQSTELTPPTGRFKWTRPFRLKDEIWFLLVRHHISNIVYELSSLSESIKLGPQCAYSLLDVTVNKEDSAIRRFHTGTN